MRTSRPLLAALVFALTALATCLFAEGDLEGALILQFAGKVELNRSGSTAWDPAQTNLVLHSGDGLKTGERSRAVLRLQDATIVPVRELTTLRVARSEGRSVLDLLGGVVSFFHRDRPSDTGVKAGSVSAIIRGTEFVASVAEGQRLSIVLLHGEVEVTNAWGSVHATTGEVIEASQVDAPKKFPGLISQKREAIQWVVYYPCVLDPADLRLTPGEASRLAPVLKPYRSGEVRQALEASLALGEPLSDGERLLRGALHLAAGQIPAMQAQLAALDPAGQQARLATALRMLVDIVLVRSGGELPVAGPASTTTERLVASYRRQADGQLAEAAQLADDALRQSPDCGFAAARLAELEFSLGAVAKARRHNQLALSLSPRLAPAMTLDGYLLAAQGAFRAARGRFDEALGSDPALGDAWLGRGLMKIRIGEVREGRLDLEAAAATEPQRSVLRGYLGKAFSEEQNDTRALEELARARELDPADPTSWLYAALIRFRQNALAEAIDDLERSVELNDNRALYRSRLLLDQDAAIRSANLAAIYESADMADVARRESARAVMFDYASASAHLNLAGSYNALRDPTRFNLRDETVWLNEHLLASLLAPTDSAPLSHNLSQNEYSRLFAHSGFGFGGTTEYFSGGEIRQLASHVGNSQKLSYALDLDYQRKSGLRPNQDLSRIEWYSRIKAQLTERDSLLLLAKYEDFDSGDNFLYADPTLLRPDFRFREQQAPVLLAGLHHEWDPGSHTLILGGRLENRQDISDLAAPQETAFAFPEFPPATAAMDAVAWNKFETYTLEACHILQRGRWTTLAGGRYQAGDFEAESSFDPAPFGPGYDTVFGPSLISSRGGGEFQRSTAYLYETWEPWSPVRITGGLGYDEVETPKLFRRPPFQTGSVTRRGWSPKGAVVYSPGPSVALRGMYAESLGGVSYDESIRLEPTQLAGFPQAFRTLISESLVGSVEAPAHTAAGAALDLKLKSRTYLSLELTRLASGVSQEYGMFIYDANRFPAPPAYATSQEREYRYVEQTARIVAHRILAEEWFLQARYQFTRSELSSDVPHLPGPASMDRTTHQESDLHRLGSALLYQRTDGWFARLVGDLYIQDSRVLSGPPHEAFAQLSAFIGYRFPRQRGDITLGLLNLAGRDYVLNPLNLHDEAPRERTLYARLRFSL